jgi:hypothetical protein
VNEWDIDVIDAETHETEGLIINYKIFSRVNGQVAHVSHVVYTDNEDEVDWYDYDHIYDEVLTGIEVHKNQDCEMLLGDALDNHLCLWLEYANSFETFKRDYKKMMKRLNSKIHDIALFDVRKLFK